MGLSEQWAEAQGAVIGSMLIDERCVGLVLGQTDEQLFPDSRLRNLYRTIRRLFYENRPIDPVTVLSASDSGYKELIAQLMQETPTAANVEEYIRILHNSARLRRFQSAAMEILAAPDADSAAAIWEKLGRELMSVQRVRCVSLETAIGQYLDRMNDTTPPDYLSFGIKQLDRLLQVGKGKFVILAADSSAGKTALSLQFAYHMAACGKKVGFFSLETDNDTLTDRLMAETQVADIALTRTKLKALTNTDFQRAVDAGQKSARIPLYLLDNCETIDELRTWTIQHGFDVIFVDYLQLIEADGDKRWDIVTNISMQLHRMARKLGVTIIGLSQVTPRADAKPLTMDDLRESRQLKHDADVIMILERPADFPEGRTLTIAKNKDGRRNKGLRLNFDAAHMTFSYYRRVEPSSVPGQVDIHELGEDEGGENPF